MCDICQSSPAVSLCHEDRAFLCRACDASIHSANEHVAAHSRFLFTNVKLELAAVGASKKRKAVVESESEEESDSEDESESEEESESDDDDVPIGQRAKTSTPAAKKKPAPGPKAGAKRKKTGALDGVVSPRKGVSAHTRQGADLTPLRT